MGRSHTYVQTVSDTDKSRC